MRPVAINAGSMSTSAVAMMLFSLLYHSGIDLGGMNFDFGSHNDDQEVFSYTAFQTEQTEKRDSK